MQFLLVEIKSQLKAKELSSMLSSMSFVKRISIYNNRKEIITKLQKHENVKAFILKNKNKAIAKYL